VRLILRLGIALQLMLPGAVCLTQSALPDDSDRQTALALEQKGSNAEAEAEAAWDKVLKAHPSSPEAYAHLGLLKALQENYKEAVPLYRKAMALDPSFPNLQLDLGLALFKSGELKPAILEFKPLLSKQDPTSPEAQRLTILIGMAEYGLGEYAAAIPYLREAANHDTESLGLRLSLAHSCLWSKQYQCVLDVYQEILLLNLDSAEADMLVGEVMDENKNAAGAIEQFRAAVKADPKLPDAHFGLGYLLWTQNQYPEAASEFQTELANNPNHILAMTYLGSTLMQLNQPQAAQTLLEEAVQHNPEIKLAHLDLGILYDDAGRLADALRELKIAEKLDPNDANVHWRLGRFYQAAGKKVEAKAEFDKTRSLQKASDDSVFSKLHPASGNDHPSVAKPEDTTSAN
jgi:tetratricopeptide (TPR) repeat protein